MFKINKRFVATIGVAGVLVGGLSACDDAPKNNAQKNEQQQASNAADSLIRNQPVHSYQFSQIRQNLQELEDSLATGTVTTSFFMNQGVVDPVMTCPSIGAPIASTTQLTNPVQSERHGDQGGGGNVVINQMDPTGVYTGDSSGTYVMCVGVNGQVNPIYWEGFVLTAFGPAHWDKANHQMVVDGPSGSKFTGIKK